MIEDVLSQNYPDFEFIIVNNGSMDGTGELLTRYAKSDNRIKVLTLNTPQSIGMGRNFGLRNAKGEYVAFVDDDDRVEPDFLEFLISLLKENGADISMCGATEGDGRTKNPQCLFNEKMVLTGEEALRLLLERKYIRAGMPTKLYKREILERHPFEEAYKNEDIHTQYKYLITSKVVAIHGLDKYYFTRHGGNVSSFTSDGARWDARTMGDYLTAFRNRTEFVKKHAPDTYEMALYTEWAFMLSMLEKIDRFRLADCEAIGREMSEVLKGHKHQFINMPQIKDFERAWLEKYIFGETFNS